MVRIAITAVANDAIASTPPMERLWPVQGRDATIRVEAVVLDRLSAMRGPGESYSDVILPLVEVEAGRQKVVVGGGSAASSRRIVEILPLGSLGYQEGVGQGQPVRLSNATPQSYERKQ
jgi:hypothetical protein